MAAVDSTEDEIKAVQYYVCDCAWITKYCDEHHLRTAYVPLSILEEHSTHSSINGKG